MNKLKKNFFVFFCLFMIAFRISTTEVLAHNEIIDEGVHGVEWYFTTDRILHLKGGNLSGHPYPWKSYSKNIEKVIFEDEIVFPESSYSMFSFFDNLKSIENMELVDTSNVKTMRGMFDNAVSLEYVNLKNLDTKNVTDMEDMFRDTPNLKYYDISSWDTSEVKNMGYMFYNSGKQSFDDIFNWNTSKLENISHMFYGTTFKKINLSNWKTPNLKFMSGLFSYTEQVEHINLSNWDVSNIVYASEVFRGITSDIQVINLSDWKFSVNTNLDNFFNNISGRPLYLDELILSNWNNLYITNYKLFDPLDIKYKIKIDGWKDIPSVDTMLKSFNTSGLILHDEFKIEGLNHKVIDLENVTITKINPIIFDKESLNKDFDVFYEGKKLEKDIDYIVYYNDNTNVGVHSHEIIGNGYNNRTKFVNRRYVNYEVLPQKPTLIKIPIANSILSGKHISESKLSNAKLIDNKENEIEGEFDWDYNNISNQNIYKSGYYPAQFNYKNYQDSENYDPVLIQVFVKVKENINNGWQKENNSWKYYKNSIAQTGWVKIDKDWYYMNASGVMQTGWTKVGSRWYYMNTSGVMQAGWTKVGSRWYYMNGSGVMQTGWTKVGTRWYYMNGSGVMQTGWTKVGSRWYYMNGSGVMQTGWTKVGSRWYYMNGSGVMQTGWTKVGSRWYYMNGSGVMQTGWTKVGSKWYYMNGSGVMQTGWKKINNKWYYLYSNGQMAASVRIGKYRLGSNGVML